MNDRRTFKFPKCMAICDVETTGLDPETAHVIEVAILFCDRDLRVVCAVDETVYLPNNVKHDQWDAMRVHGIMPDELNKTGYPTFRVAQKIESAVHRAKRLTRASRVVLCSDNAQFEHRFLQKLLAGREWPFHYATWDSNLLLEATGVGDPVPLHRAMADVGRLHASLVEAMRRIS